MTSPLIPFQAFDHDKLQKAQATNLKWCETWGRSLPGVNGVPIGLGLTYDLIALLNRSEIEAILGQDPRVEFMEDKIKEMMEAERKPKRARGRRLKKG